MTDIMVMQGREVSGADIGLIRDLLVEHPHWGRTRLSEELCRRWGWRNAQGRPKDMAARTLLLKLERGGHIRLPPRQRPSSNGFRNRHVLVVQVSVLTIDTMATPPESGGSRNAENTQFGNRSPLAGPEAQAASAVKQPGTSILRNLLQYLVLRSYWRGGR